MSNPMIIKDKYDRSGGYVFNPAQFSVANKMNQWRRFIPSTTISSTSLTTATEIRIPVASALRKPNHVFLELDVKNTDGVNTVSPTVVPEFFNQIEIWLSGTQTQTI